MVVDEQYGIARNQIYDATEVYLRTVDNPDSERFKVNKSSKQKTIGISMDKNEEVVDHFKGFKLKWQFFLVEPENQDNHFRPEKIFFELSFDKSRKDDVLNEYLPLKLWQRRKKSKIRGCTARTVHLIARMTTVAMEVGIGDANPYFHSFYFGSSNNSDKLAMDPYLKKSIIEDLKFYK